MKIIRSFFVAFLILTFNQSLYAECTNIQIGRMIKRGLTENEINELCGEQQNKKSYGTKSENEEMRKEPLQTKYEKRKEIIKQAKYSDKIRTNEGNLTTTYLNPPKYSDTRFYAEIGQTLYSVEKRKNSSSDKETTLDTENYYNKTNISIGIDNKLFEDELHYISFNFSKSDLKYIKKTIQEVLIISTTTTTNALITYEYKYTIDDYTINNKLNKYSFEYIHQFLNNLFLGIAYHRIYNTLNVEYYEIFHDFPYQSIRLQNIYNDIKLDLIYLPDVTSKENISGNTQGDITLGYGKTIGANVTFLGKNQDISLGYTKQFENESAIDPEKFTMNPENATYNISYQKYTNGNFLFGGAIEYKKAEKITDLLSPHDIFTLNAKVLLKNVFLIKYEYEYNKWDDLGISFYDKYRVNEEHVNLLSLGFIYNL